MNLTQTNTTVHSPAAQLHQRWASYVRDQHKLSALMLTAQLWTGYCMYLMDHVSTPSYLSILSMLLPSAVVYMCFSAISKRIPQSKNSMLTALLPHIPGRIIEFLLAVSLLLDAVILLYGAVSLLGVILPDIRRWIIAPLYVLLCASSVIQNKPFAIIRLAGWAFFPLLFILLFSTLPTLNQGSFSHFFPFLGPGHDAVKHGSIWISGCFGAFLIPLLLPDEEEALSRMRREKKPRSLGILLSAFAFTLLIICLYTYLMPPYALSRPRSIGNRLLLPAQISSSVPGWTIFTCALLLLFMIAYTGSIVRSAALFYGRNAQNRIWPNTILLLLFTVTMPLPALYSQAIQDTLIRIAPFRIVPYLLALSASAIGMLLRLLRRRKTHEE